jgi:GntR family transcriptional regulator
VIEFHLDGRSGVPPYLQLIHQVRHALRLGLLREGDQLPKVKDVAAGLAINPNTVLKVYRELEYERLVAARPGVGTFVTGTLDGGSLAAHGPLQHGWWVDYPSGPRLVRNRGLFVPKPRIVAPTCCGGCMTWRHRPPGSADVRSRLVGSSLN